MTSPTLVAESWESLFRAQVSVVRRLAADDIWDVVSMREYDVLLTLSRCTGVGLRMHELNREILLSQPSLSRMVERLHARGLVTRTSAPGDGRGTVVALTPEGRAVQRRIGRQHVESISRNLGSALEETELTELRRLCDKIRRTDPAAQTTTPGPHAPQTGRTT